MEGRPRHFGARAQPHRTAAPRSRAKIEPAVAHANGYRLCMELDRTEARILGALFEKRWTTPDAYPLSLNALIAACNQKSNRDPVLHLEEFEITGCLMGLRQNGLMMIHEREGGRVLRYGEKLMDELRMSRQEVAILTELLLRGPQTSGELVRRGARMAPMGSQTDVEQLLRDLAGGHYVSLLPKASGQRYARWRQLLCMNRVGADEDEAEEGEAEAEGAEPSSQPVEPMTQPPIQPQTAAPRPVMDTGGPVLGVAMPASGGAESWREEIDELRQELIALRRRVAELEDQGGGGSVS